MKTKRCSKCRKLLPAEKFRYRRITKDELEGQCRNCISRRSKKYYNKNKECINWQNKEHYNENKERICQQKGEYYLINKERINRRHKERREQAKADGLCTICRKRLAEPGRVTCKVCLECERISRNKYEKKHHIQAKKNKTCYRPSCFKPQFRGIYCEEHREVINMRTQKSRNKLNRTRIDAGLCQRCGKPCGKDGNRAYCYRCRMENIIKDGIRRTLDDKRQTKNYRSWEKFVDFTLDDFLAHVKYWENIQDINSGEIINIHHILSLGGNDWKKPGDKEWKRVWALDNLMPLRESDHYAVHRGNFNDIHPNVRKHIHQKEKAIIKSSIGTKVAEVSVEADTRTEADILICKEIRKLGIKGATYKLS